MGGSDLNTVATHSQNQTVTTPPAAHTGLYSGSHGVPIPGEFRPRFAKFFARFVRGMFTRKFHVVRIVASSRNQLRALSNVDEPVIVLLNHASWWDPLVCVLLGEREIIGRSAMAPMEADQLRRFSFFRKLGLFGVEADNRDGLRVMREYVLERFARDTKPTLWITPQGEFTDVRTPIKLRLGAAGVAAKCPACRVVSVAIEYGFWVDQKPEVFIRAQTIANPRVEKTQTQTQTQTQAEAQTQTQTQTASMRDWHRAMTLGMQHNAQQLAALVTARDPAAFERLVGGDSTTIHPVYDWWLRIRGKSGAIRATTRQNEHTSGRLLARPNNSQEHAQEVTP